MAQGAAVAGGPARRRERLRSTEHRSPCGEPAPACSARSRRVPAAVTRVPTSGGDLPPTGERPLAARPVLRNEPKAPFGSRGMRDAALSFCASLVIGVVSAVIVSRLYGVEVIGEFALVCAPFAMVMSFSNV